MNFAVRLPPKSLVRVVSPSSCCAMSSASICAAILMPSLAILRQRAAIVRMPFFGHHRSRQKHSFFTNAKRLRPIGGGAVVLMAFSIKHLFKIGQTTLDEDPLKDKVKRAMLHRKYGEWTAAVEVLNDALKEAIELGNDVFVSRMYYELATTYAEAGQLENAQELLTLLHNRYLTLHRSTGLSSEVIENSLRLADVYARMGNLETAEAAYKYCLTTQMEVMDKHLADYHVARGAILEVELPIETRGCTYTDPIALFGMCLEDYAYFLVDNYPDTRLDEAEEYLKEALKISYQIFGLSASHSLNMLCTFGAKCILKNKFEMARNFLEIGVNRVLLVPDSESTVLLTFYCNYAESLFHTGDFERAVDYAKRAQKLSQASDIDPAVRAHVRNFAREMERDVLRLTARRGGERTTAADDGGGGIARRLWPFK
uniref:TPR_REGION domain-containing protein n=1 Tax=Globodera pallida TaxID=36090 RepID=A0A183C4A4_GLOPA